MHMHDVKPVDFGRLKERLLAGGIAPRHVRRTLRELREHFEDAVRDERRKGKEPGAAEQSAWKRLGNEDDVAASILARPELRSLPARYPRLIFGAGPVFLWALAVAAALFKLAVFVEGGKALGLLPPAGTVLDPPWVQALAHALCFFYERLLPLLIGLWLTATAIRQRLETPWLPVGAALIAIIAGLSNIHVRFAEKIGEKGELFISFAAEKNQLGMALMIAAVEFALIVTPYLLWRRRHAGA